MADRIKGIVVEIGGDTVGLNRALADVNQNSRDLQGELRQVERLLQFDESNTELIAQQQEILNRQIENTSDKLNRLRSVQEQVEQQFQSGEIGAEQYRRFQREIIQTEQQLERLQGTLQETGRTGRESAREITSSFADTAAGIGAAMGAAGIVEKALGAADLNAIIDVSFDLPEDSQEVVREAIKTVEAYGIDAETSLAGVRKQWQLNTALTDEQNAAIVKGAALISKAYAEVDFTELLQETHEMALGMEMTHDEALGMTKALLDMGFPPDQLDIITEYGQQLTRAGYSSQEIQNIFAAGVETGTWNIDVLLDGLKEGRIRAAEFAQGLDKATVAAIDGTKISHKQLEAWGKAIAEGGDKGKKAMSDMAKAVLEIEDATKRNEVGVKVFGTLWEENGEMLAEALAGTERGTADLDKQMKELNADVALMDASPQVELTNALNEMWKVLQPLLSTVAEWISKLANWIQENETLAATIAAVAVVIGIIVGALMALAPILTAVIGLAGMLGVGIGAITAPIWITIAAIVALIAIGVALYKNWDTVSVKVAEFIEKMNKSVDKFEEKIRSGFRKAWENVVKYWGKVTEFLSKIDLMQMGKDAIQGLIDGIASMADKLFKKARELAQGVGKSISKALKTGSPSKVTMQLGEFAGQGLIEGLNNTISSVKNMSEKMAFAAVPDIPNRSAGQAGNTNKNLTVNIHSPKALDVREANKVFNRTLTKMATQW